VRAARDLQGERVEPGGDLGADAGGGGAIGATVNGTANGQGASLCGRNQFSFAKSGSAAKSWSDVTRVSRIWLAIAASIMSACDNTRPRALRSWWITP